jgi:dGTPase
VVLNQAAVSWGGFEGNAQSFRIVSFLALRDRRYRGLNLTRRTLNAILKYPWVQDIADSEKTDKWGAYETERAPFDFARSLSPQDIPSLEAQIMDWSDDVTYAVHDLEDFFKLGLIPLDRLGSTDDAERRRFVATFFTDHAQTIVKSKFKKNGLSGQNLLDALDRLFTHATAPLGLIGRYRGTQRDRWNVRAQTSYLIGRFVNAATRKGEKLDVAVDERAEVAVLKELAWFYVITDPSLSTIQHGQERVISELHNIYRGAAIAGGEDWSLFPHAQQELLQGIHSQNDASRIATDLVAGLTENLAYELHRRLTGVSRGSILDAAAHASR